MKAPQGKTGRMLVEMIERSKRLPKGFKGIGYRITGKC
jgi:hypothetical protein